MSFATPADLLRRSNADRLLQLSIPADMGMVSSGALRDAISGVGLGGYDADVRDTINAALEVIDCALGDATALISGYGVSQDASSESLKRIASTLAMYYLLGNGRGESDEKEYAATIKLLESHAKGVINLVPMPVVSGSGSAVVDMSAGNVVVFSNPSRYSYSGGNDF